MSRTSKTARASAVRGKSVGFNRSPDSPILIPLADGRYAYVMSNEGRTVHLATGSDTFLTALTSIGDSDRVTKTLTGFHTANPSHGWDIVVKRFAEFSETTEAIDTV